MAAASRRQWHYLSAISSAGGVDPWNRAAAFADGPVPGFNGIEFSIVGRPDDAATLTMQRAAYRIVSPDYFGVLRIPILAGRSFTDADLPTSLPVAIINEHMARQFWRDQNPIGQQIRSGAGPRSQVLTIVGVVGNVRATQFLEPVPQIYASYLQAM